MQTSGGGSELLRNSRRRGSAKSRTEHDNLECGYAACLCSVSASVAIIRFRLQTPHVFEMQLEDRLSVGEHKMLANEVESSWLSNCRTWRVRASKYACYLPQPNMEAHIGPCSKDTGLYWIPVKAVKARINAPHRTV